MLLPIGGGFAILEAKYLFSFISWIAMIVVGILVVLFAISNRSTVMLELWPLPYLIPFPFYGAVLIAAILGFLGGAVVAWFSGGRTRRKARNARQKASGLEKNLVKLREKIEEMESHSK